MSEIRTLITLLEDYEICIPIIQRDYAQGRDNEKTNEVRKNLIKDIKKCLEEDKNIDFNFVYGTVSENVFYPVDGQQRLTSLYLLHWYINQNLNQDRMDKLHSFSYMTRNSASEFFSFLRKPNKELKQIAKESKCIKQDVINQAWFQVEWKLDPTVNAGLNFLDDLSKDDDFKTNANKYFDRLLNGAIKFSFISEQGDNAEVDAAKTYIRMNARGKKLASYENLKAMIDSIENSIIDLKKGNFVECYDKKYIDVLYSQECENDTLEEKTNHINDKSLCVLKNIYNLLCQLSGKNIIPEIIQFISIIYDISQSKLNDTQKDFFKKYLDVVKVIYDYYCDNSSDGIIADIFEEKGYFLATDNRKIIATILYIYHGRQKGQQKKEDDVKKYLYILENLNYCEWVSDKFLNAINYLSESISEKENVLDYFCTDNCNNMNTYLLEVLPDIKVRIKEQTIKASIISSNQLDFYYFQDLEKLSPYKKMQYILWISGYWRNNEGDKNALDKYMECAKKYFHSNYNDIKWRKLFAIASNLLEDKKLKGSKEINEKCNENYVWKDEFYYWDDLKEQKSEYNIKIFETIKMAYDISDNYINYESELLTDDYVDCWLRYAVKYSNLMLLNQELIWNDNKVELANGKRYDMHILNVTQNARYGLMNLQKCAQAQYRFEPNNQYNGGPVTGDRAFIMRVVVPAKVVGINENYTKEMCMCYWDLKNYIYIIYDFSGKDYSYQEYKYDLTDEIAKLLENVHISQQNLTEYTIDDYKDVYNKGNTKNGDSFSRDGGTSYWYSSAIKINNLAQPVIANLN